MKITLAADRLDELSGGFLNSAIQNELGVIVRDLTDRPGVQKARELCIRMRFVPKVDPRGIATRAQVEIGVDSAKLPRQETRVSEVALRGDGTAEFRPDSPEAVNQHTLGELVEKDGAE